MRPVTLKLWFVFLFLCVTQTASPLSFSLQVGDVAFDEAKEVAGQITPVPGAPLGCSLHGLSWLLVTAVYRQLFVCSGKVSVCERACLSTQAGWGR